jgi:hypothetical protein
LASLHFTLVGRGLHFKPKGYGFCGLSAGEV